MAPPNIAGILANFITSFGSTRANDMVRTAGTLCSEYDPSGHGFRLPNLMAPSDRSKPPAAGLDRCKSRREILDEARRAGVISRGAKSRLLMFALGNIAIQALRQQGVFLIMRGQTVTAICLDARHVAAKVKLKLAHGDDVGLGLTWHYCGWSSIATWVFSVRRKCLQALRTTYS